MGWGPPKEIKLEYQLFGGGTVQFGYAVRTKGMTVGTAPFMGRVLASGYPDGWFTIKHKHPHQVREYYEKFGENFIPTWLRADLYEYHYYQLKNENDKIKP